MSTWFDFIRSIWSTSDDTVRVKGVSGFGGTDPVGLKNTSGTPINPATQDTLEAIRLLLDTVETKLQSIIDNTDGLETYTDQVETLLTSIRDYVDTLETKSSAAVPTAVASSASSITLKASNTNRLGLSIYNDSTAILYVKLGTTASATDYNIKMMPNSYWESPVNYTGRVDGIWASANGFAYVTEYVA